MSLKNTLKKTLVTIFAATTLTGGLAKMSKAQNPPSYTQAVTGVDADVEFKRVKNKDKVLRNYPFLDSLFNDIKADIKTLKDNGVRVQGDVYIATVKTGAEQTELLFVKTGGTLYSGTLGSPVDVYMRKEGQAFKQVLSVITYDEIKVKAAQGNKPVSLVLRTPDGSFRTWALDNQTGRFEIQPLTQWTPGKTRTP